MVIASVVKSTLLTRSISTILEPRISDALGPRQPWSPPEAQGVLHPPAFYDYPHLPDKKIHEEWVVSENGVTLGLLL